MPYIGRSTDGFGVRNRFLYLASASDTSVSGADANGATLTFTDGAYVDVYLNGVLLKAGTDYNTNTANTIAGISSMSANDEVTVIVYDVFTVGDMVSATSGGTFSGAVTLSGGVTGDLDLNTDSAAIKFGADDDVTVTHDPDDGLILKSTATGDDNPFLLTLQTGETDLAANDVIGKIAFQAPDEGTGTDAILVSAAIQAVAEGDHSASSNATSLQFMTGASEAASEKMRINSSGNVGIGTTPESHHANWTAIDFGDQGFIGHYDGGDTVIATNAYYDGAWKAKETGVSSLYSQFGVSGHLFRVGASASADAAITLTEAMRIDANAIVTMPQQPAFIAHNNSNNNHTFSSNDTYEVLAFNVETIDKNSDFSNSTFTAPVDGTYFITSHQMFNAASSGEIRHDLAIYVNSTLTLYKQAKGDNYAIAKSMNIVGLVDLDANDTVKVYARVSDTSKGRIYVSQTTSTFHGYLVA